MAYESEIEKLQRRYDEKPEQWFAALADAYRKAGRLDDALDIVRVGIDDRPNYVSGHIVLGRCLVDKGEDSEARAVFERVLGLDAENIIALRMLADVSERQDDVAGATEWLQRLLDIDPMNDDAREALTRLETLAAETGAGESEEAAGGEPDAGLVVETAAEMAGVGAAPDAPVDDPLEPIDLDPAGDTDPDGRTGPGGTVRMEPPAETAAQDDRMAAEPGLEPTPAPTPPPPAPTANELPSFDLGVADSPDESTLDLDGPGAALDPPELVAEEPPPLPEPPPASEPPVPAASEDTDPEKPFVIRQSDSPFEASEPKAASFDEVLPDNQGGVFGVNEIDFDGASWKDGPAESDDSPLPVGEQEVTLDSFDQEARVSLGEDVGMPTSDREISLDDFAPPPPRDEPVVAESGLPDPHQSAETESDLAPMTSHEVPAEVDSGAGDKDEDEPITQPIPAVSKRPVAEPEPEPPVEAVFPGDETEPALEDTVPEVPPVSAFAAEPVFAAEPEVEPEPESAPSEPVIDSVWPEPSPSLAAPSADETAEPPSLVGSEAWPEPSAGLEPPELAVEPSTPEPPTPEEPAGGEDVPVAAEGPTKTMEPEELAAAIERTVAGRGATPDTPAVDADLVTETMAEVYARQGLVSEARAVYEQLIEANPTDEGLRRRLAELTPGDESEPGEERAGAGSYRASQTGAMGVRTFLANVLAARPGSDVITEPRSAAPSMAGPSPSPPTALEEAFGAGEDDSAPETSDPADDTPLAAVFDQDAPAERAPEPDASDEKDLSFDQFFRSDQPAEDAPTDDKSDDEDFKTWLQGLKS